MSLLEVGSYFVSQEAANFGNFSTGIAAILTVIFAAYGVFVEVREWHRRTVKSKEAEIAGRVFYSVIRLFQAIDYFSSPALDVTETSDELKQRFPKSHLQRENFRLRMEVTAKDVDDFIKAKNESEVYLSDEINSVLNELWKRWTEIKVSYQMHMLGLDQDATRHSEIQRAYLDVFGQEGKQKNGALRQRIAALLRPLARLEGAA